MSTATHSSLRATCDGCGQQHEAEYSHPGRFNEGPIFAVTCTEDGLTSYHTIEGLDAVPCPVRGHHAHDLRSVSWHEQDGGASLGRKVECGRNGWRWFLVDGRQPNPANRIAGRRAS